MNKDKIEAIIEATLRSGNTNPNVFEITKLVSVKSKLQRCTTIPEVLTVLEDHRSLITKSFGLHDQVLNEGMTKIKALEA